MKLKLNNQQISCLQLMLSSINYVPFSTGYEQELTVGVLKKLYSKLLLKSISNSKVKSIEIEPETLCALNYVMSKIGDFSMFNPLVASELNLLFRQINQEYIKTQKKTGVIDNPPVPFVQFIYA